VYITEKSHSRNVMYLYDRGGYTPYATCMDMPLVNVAVHDVNATI